MCYANLHANKYGGLRLLSRSLETCVVELIGIRGTCPCAVQLIGSRATCPCIHRLVVHSIRSVARLGLRKRSPQLSIGRHGQSRMGDHERRFSF